MSKSIMHNKADRTCYLCMLLEDDATPKRYLEEHHIFGGQANRRLSEKYGLKVYLCRAHHEGDMYGHMYAVHHPECNEYQELLHREGQVAFMRDRMKKTFCTKKQAEKVFRGIFGKSYIDVEEWEP